MQTPLEYPTVRLCQGADSETGRSCDKEGQWKWCPEHQVQARSEQLREAKERNRQNSESRQNRLNWFHARMSELTYKRKKTITEELFFRIMDLFLNSPEASGFDFTLTFCACSDSQLDPPVFFVSNLRGQPYYTQLQDSSCISEQEENTDIQILYTYIR